MALENRRRYVAAIISLFVNNYAFKHGCVSFW